MTTSLANINRRIATAPAGLAFTRAAISLIRARGDLYTASRLAAQYTDTPSCAALVKAAALAGSTSDVAWGAPLAYMSNAVAEFVGALHPRTVLGRLDGARAVPLNIRHAHGITGASVGWVGQGAPIPATSLTYATGSIGISKSAGLVVLTRELVESSDPAAELLVRDELLSAIAEFLDRQLLDPSVAAIPNVQPASVTNGLTPTLSSGSTVTAITQDLAAAVAALVTAGVHLTAAFWVLHPLTAVALAMKRTTDGAPAFPTVTARGGELAGLPVLTSVSVPGDPISGFQLTLIDAAELQHADGGLTLDLAENASVQMLTNPATGATSQVSLFQSGLVGLRAVRFANWRMRRPGAVAFVADAKY